MLQSTPLKVTLVGFGAIGQTILKRLQGSHQVVIDCIVVREKNIAAIQALIGTANIQVCSKVPPNTKLILECAGHSALSEHIIPALTQGVECAVLSVGALASQGLHDKLEAAAIHGHTKLHLLAGAIGGIDAIAAARTSNLETVTYTGRKPPNGWKGSAAQELIDLDSLTAPTVFFEGTARQAAERFPKNANVAATVALAGLGLDRTSARLIADPTISENIHEISAKGDFGEFNLRMCGKPLAENPKTSALTVLSALRFLNNHASHLTI